MSSVGVVLLYWMLSFVAVGKLATLHRVLKGRRHVVFIDCTRDLDMSDDDFIETLTKVSRNKTRDSPRKPTVLVTLCSQSDFSLPTTS